MHAVRETSSFFTHIAIKPCRQTEIGSAPRARRLPESEKKIFGQIPYILCRAAEYAAAVIRPCRKQSLPIVKTRG